MISLAQKMVISQGCEADEMMCWIVTLLSTDGKSSQNQINSFNLSQENVQYSGIVLYTSLDGRTSRVERYENGVVMETVNVCAEHHEGEVSSNLIGDYDFYKDDAVAIYRASEGGGGGGGTDPLGSVK